MTAARDIARRVAIDGLVATEGITIDPSDNIEVLRQLRSHRIEGVAVSMLERGDIDADDAFSSSLTGQHDETMAQVLRIEIAAIRVSELLGDHGITHRLLKGAALAHGSARMPRERSFRDVDVLVPSTSIDDAVSMLEFEGAVRLQPELRPGFDARFAKSVTMQLDDVEIDVHRLLAPGPFGVWMHPNDLFLLGSTQSIGDAEIPTLDVTEHLLHACFHVALGSVEPALINLRDIALLANSDCDVERFAETVERWRGRAVVQRAVKLVADELGIELPEGLARYRHEPVEASERSAIGPYLTNDPRGRFAALAPATFKALPRTDRVAFARAVGLPDGTNASDRVRSLIDRVR